MVSVATKTVGGRILMGYPKSMLVVCMSSCVVCDGSSRAFELVACSSIVVSCVKKRWENVALLLPFSVSLFPAVHYSRSELPACYYYLRECFRIIPYQ